MDTLHEIDMIHSLLLDCDHEDLGRIYLYVWHLVEEKVLTKVEPELPRHAYPKPPKIRQK